MLEVRMFPFSSYSVLGSFMVFVQKRLFQWTVCFACVHATCWEWVYVESKTGNFSNRAFQNAKELQDPFSSLNFTSITSWRFSLENPLGFRTWDRSEPGASKVTLHHGNQPELKKLLWLQIARLSRVFVPVRSSLVFWKDLLLKFPVLHSSFVHSQHVACTHTKHAVHWNKHFWTRILTNWAPNERKMETYELLTYSSENLASKLPPPRIWSSYDQNCNSYA